MNKSELVLVLDPKLVLAFQEAAQKAGLTIDSIRKLVDPEFLKKIDEVFIGKSVIVPVELTIDFEADPYLPSDWRRIRHERSSRRAWNSSQFELYWIPAELSKLRKSKKGVTGKSFVDSISKDRRVVNVRMLDYLWHHPQFLPTSWSEWLKADKDNKICFVGTTYTDHQVHECVRCLCFNDEGKLIWRPRKLLDYWNEKDAIVLMIA